MQVTDHRMTFRGLISLIALSVALVVWPSTPQSQVTRHLSRQEKPPEASPGAVVGSVALVLAVPGLFSAPGVAAVLAVASIVLTFFDLQVYALWKTRA